MVSKPAPVPLAPKFNQKGLLPCAYTDNTPYVAERLKGTASYTLESDKFVLMLRGAGTVR